MGGACALAGALGALAGLAAAIRLGVFAVGLTDVRLAVGFGVALAIELAVDLVVEGGELAVGGGLVAAVGVRIGSQSHGGRECLD